MHWEVAALGLSYAVTVESYNIFVLSRSLIAYLSKEPAKRHADTKVLHANM